MDGEERPDWERGLLLAYNYLLMSCDNTVLTEHVRQGLFRAAIMAYFSCMTHERELKKQLFAHLGRNTSKLDTVIFLRHHERTPDVLIQTYKYFERMRNKVVAHQDIDGRNAVALKSELRWLRLPQWPDAVQRRIRRHFTKASFVKVEVLDVTYDDMLAMLDLVDVTLQVLWQMNDELKTSGD